VRAAAKNQAFTTIASNPDQYAEILDQVRRHGGTTLELRRRLAAAAFAHTAAYDQAIAAHFAVDAAAGPLPRRLVFSLHRKAELRYGENPHQQAALYELAGGGSPSLVTARQLHGKELSYNNLLDLDAALAIVRDHAAPLAVVLKHNNPCGAATAASLSVAARNALEGDPVSAFGSILGFNRPLDVATADVLVEPQRFIEAVLAPDFEPDALQTLTTRPKWKASVRLIAFGPLSAARSGLDCRSIDGGFLVQTPDSSADDESQWQVVTERPVDPAALADLRFAWAIVRHVKSNAIVLARDGALVGVGAGQMSRVDSVRIAIGKAGERARGAVLASDAFFPFADSIDAAAAAGVRAIIQPGESRRDQEVIAACNQRGLPMIFTGRRHFRH
jgi:phosphoribosylaminoimidazolecarboxamide formyltransferase/IMP cyclohydrolase